MVWQLYTWCLSSHPNDFDFLSTQQPPCGFINITAYFTHTYRHIADTTVRYCAFIIPFKENRWGTPF